MSRFYVPWDFFEESKQLLYFVLGMYGEDENGCWQPWNRGRHSYDVINMAPVKSLI